MKSLTDKIVRMMAAIFELMEVEPPSFNTASIVSDELATDNERSDADHKLIELCW
ncbi:MAG TPA: hypothetical protein VIV66_07250 [Pyrinomonadaceae bacterium]